MRYAYGAAAAILLGGAAATLTLNPLGAQPAQNEPGALEAAVPRAGAPMSFAELVERLQPAVVNISTRQSVQIQQRRLPPGMEEFFRRFGQEMPGDGGGPTVQRGGSLGSGFIVSADGFIVTNNHVVAPARPDAVVEQITVTLADRTEFEAEVVGRDVATDIAVLKINPTRPLPFVRFGDSSRVRVGDWIVAIGNPFGLGGTVTAGIVSALHRNIGAGLYDRFIQTDAPINMGNSGGPMFDLNGNVVGIATALYSPTGSNVGIGFAIPAEQVRPVVEALRQGERVRRGYIGIAMQDVDERVAASFGIQRDHGTVVRAVTPGGAAERAGIRQGDVIVAVGGVPVTPDQTLGYLVARQPIGTRVPFTIKRQDQQRISTLTVNVTVAERPSEEDLSRLIGTEDDAGDGDSPADAKPDASAPTAGQRAVRDSLGVTLGPLTPAIASRLGIRDTSVRGLVVLDVDPNSDAGQRGIQAGDLILSVNQASATSPEAVTSAIEAARRAGRGTVLLLVRRGNAPPLYVGVELAPPAARR